jgi:triosephosphate isomerase
METASAGFKSTPAISSSPIASRAAACSIPSLLSEILIVCSTRELEEERLASTDQLNQSAMTTKPSMQSEAAAVAEKSAAVGRGVEATEEQARAIICTAKKAVEEEAKTKKTRADGGAGSAAGKPSSSSLKRSLECFLQGRKNKPTSSSAATRRHLETSTASSSSSSN